VAYYCIVTGVSRPAPSRVTVAWDLRDDATTPNPVLQSGSVSLELLPIDATAADGTTPLTPAQRRAYVKNQLTELFTSLIRRVQGADADYAAVAAGAVGFRVP
jgi:hypothetical protein